MQENTNQNIPETFCLDHEAQFLPSKYLPVQSQR